LVTEQLTSSPRRDSLMTPCKMVLFCCLTWLLSFINISPTLFEVDDPNLDFGKFGYNDVGICNVAPGTSTKRSMAGFAFSVGFLVPCLLINISYITLFCLLKHRSSQTTNILGNNQNIWQCKDFSLNLNFENILIPTLTIFKNLIQKGRLQTALGRFLLFPSFLESNANF